MVNIISFIAWTLLVPLQMEIKKDEIKKYSLFMEEM